MLPSQFSLLNPTTRRILRLDLERVYMYIVELGFEHDRYTDIVFVRSVYIRNIKAKVYRLKLIFFFIFLMRVSSFKRKSCSERDTHKMHELSYSAVSIFTTDRHRIAIEQFSMCGYLENI